MDIKSDMDLSGKLIIKVSLGDDIRRIPIHNEAITYDELVLMMQRVFRGKLSANDEITLKYKDEDGDLITIFDSSDLSFAIQCSRILKLHILLPKTVTPESSAVISDSDVGKLKNQLRSIRDEVNKILDSLDGKGNKNETGNVKSEPSTEASLPNTTALNKVNSSEFDPLQEKAQQQQNGEDKKEPPKPMQQHQRPGSEPNSRPQSVSMPAPTPPMQAQPQPTSAANHNSHVGDYFSRTTAANSYPQMQYASMPYQPQYSYPSAGYVMDSSQVPSSGAYSVAGQQQQQTVSQQSQAAHPYPTQPQPQYGNPPAGGVVYPAQQTQANNPYSKGYTQPSPQHGYMPPRQ